MTVLFVSPYLPTESGSGGAMRTYHMYEELNLQFQVDFVLSNASLNISNDIQQFKRKATYKGNLLVDVWKQPKLFSRPRLNSKIEELLKKTKYDYIFIRYYSTAYWLGLIGLDNVIIDCDDCLIETNKQIETLLAKQKLKGLFLSTTNRLAEHRYLSDLKKCKAALFAKKNNNINWRENFHIAANKIASVNDDNKNPVRDNPDTYNILFIGLLGYYPNYIGLHYFITSIWRSVYQQLNSKVCLRIVGAGLPSEYQLAWSAVPGIDIRGFVHDLSDAYENVDLSIVPIYQGSGTHIKILEALVRGIPLVITPLAHRGFEETLKDEECLRVAQDDHSFANKIVELIGNKDLRISQSREGMEKVKQHHVFVPGDIGLEDIMPCT